MPPDEPGAPSQPHDSGSTATFREGVEPADPPQPREAPADRPATEPERSPAEHEPSQPPERRPWSEPKRPPTYREPAREEPPSRPAPEPTAPAVRDVPPREVPTEVPPAELPPTEVEQPAIDEAPKPVPPRRRLLDDPDPDRPKAPKAKKVRARKVSRVVRHIDPWSVLKISVLFFTSIFLIICVASAVLWNAARSAGAIDDVESFITSLGFGNCEDIGGEDTSDTPVTASTIPGSGPQVGGASTTTVPVAEDTADERSTIPDEDGKCGEGQRLVGGFKFEDERIFQSFALGGIVLVLSGAAFSVVLALLFNLISDLTGGVRVTVVQEPAVARRRPQAEGAADGEPKS